MLPSTLSLSQHPYLCVGSCLGLISTQHTSRMQSIRLPNHKSWMSWNAPPRKSSQNSLSMSNGNISLTGQINSSMINFRNITDTIWNQRLPEVETQSMLGEIVYSNVKYRSKNFKAPNNEKTLVWSLKFCEHVSSLTSYQRKGWDRGSGWPWLKRGLFFCWTDRWGCLPSKAGLLEGGRGPRSDLKERGREEGKWEGVKGTWLGGCRWNIVNDNVQGCCLPDPKWTVSTLL